ncbi:tigger transposable element-derived protein 6 [Latimeria chalumnae]|uniref:tigger transposable element-derived protein 6 n=1 Tax=Latimeria chalumnae TaxID=7897 RepID=UPI0003C149D7|nr:PREDICTED: tigger transposable element-derived protein 6-like [Latimeria chalumnae]|eukprot:XP_006008358.1 PREDICTED: tigger transposable element-derived protein 6-like [Latimeria chalumnae]
MEGEAGLEKKVRKIRRDPTLAEKVKILEMLQHPNASQSSVARALGLSQSTVSRVVKKQQEILERWNQNENPSRKRIRPYKNARVDEALLHWFLAARVANCPVPGSVLMRRAQTIAMEMGVRDFKPSNGWLWRWKERYRFFFRGNSAQGRRDDVAPTHHLGCFPDQQTLWFLRQRQSEAMLQPGCPSRPGPKALEANGALLDRQIQTVIIKSESEEAEEEEDEEEEEAPNCLQDYSPSNIFNAGEAALLFRAVPGRTGKDWPRERVSVVLCCNVSGTEKRRLLVLGREELLRSGEVSPVQFRISEAGTLTPQVFAEWLAEWDRQLAKEGRRVALILRFRSPQPPRLRLPNISLYLLPDTKSCFSDPLDQGVTPTFRALYRRHFLNRVCRATGSGGLHAAAQVSLTEAVRMMEEAWREVGESAIAGSFRRAGFQSNCDTPITTVLELTPPAGLTAEEFQCYASLEDSDHSDRPYQQVSGMEDSEGVTEDDIQIVIIKEENEEGRARDDGRCCRGGEILHKGHLKKPAVRPAAEADPQISKQKPHRAEVTLGGPGASSERPVKGKRLWVGEGAAPSPQELRAACNVIWRHLRHQGQDMGAFRQLERQLETWISQEKLGFARK